MSLLSSTSRRLLAGASLLLLAGAGPAQLSPEWGAEVSVGASLGAGAVGSVTDADGVTYIAAIVGQSTDTDVLTTAIGADGSVLWTKTYDSGNGADQARGIALGPDGSLFVTGNALNTLDVSNMLLLEYDRATGALLDVVEELSFSSEHGASVDVDSAGNVAVVGATTGDGGDALVRSYTPAGQLRWQATYDGPAFGPFSQDTGLQVLVDDDDDVVALIHGIMGNAQPDYVVVKYSGADGSVLWTATWGSNGGDYASTMTLDAAGDVYVTGTAIDLIDKFSTIKLDGDDGGLVWQAYDAIGLDHLPSAITLDGLGGVYVSGRSDPDGNQSNFNDDFFTVKRDATTGAQFWVHAYGESCIGCFDVSSDVLVDGQGRVYLTGSTSSPPYGADMILFVLDAQTGVEITRGVVSGDANEAAGGDSLALDAQGNVYVTGGISNGNTGQAWLAVWQFAALGDPWSDLGSGLAGTGGLVPALVGEGPLTGGSANGLVMTDALPGAGATLVAGFSRIDAPFKGGVLVPSPDVLLAGLTVDATGGTTLPFTWPTGIPAGTTLAFQQWVVDAGGPAGLSATNGLEGTAQ